MKSALLAHAKEQIDILQDELDLELAEDEKATASLLKAWKAYLNTSFSDPSAPLDDLRLMDQFAKIIYKHAVYQFPDNYLEDAISKRMQSLFGFTREAFSGKKEEENIPKSEMKHTTLFAEDNPIANFFQHNNKKGIDDEQWRKVFKV